MHKLIITSLALVIFSSQAFAVELKSEEQKFSYFLGVQMGHQFKNDGIVLDRDAFWQGIQDIKNGAKQKLSPEEMKATLQRFQMAKKAAASKAGSAALKEGEMFLDANKKKEGVKVTASGLQYKVITAGTGKKPSGQDVVKVHYRGSLINGTEFDSSYKRGTPAEFPVDGVIPGWTEALQMMKEGAKWQLFIPSDLAYGPRGAGGIIVPNSTLIFDVELLSVAAK